MAGASTPGPVRDWGGESPWGGTVAPVDRPSLRPDFGDPGGFEPETNALWGIRLPWNQPGQPFYADAGELLNNLVTKLEHLTDADDLDKLIKRLLGPQCFSLGVVYGIGEGFVVSVVDLLKLVKTFLLADLYDATRRSPAWTMWQPGGIIRYTTAHMLEKYFGEALYQAAVERDELISEIKAIFASPGAFFEKMADQYAEKFRLFLHLSADSSLASQFQAGKIFGELLLDVLAIVGTGAALAKLAGRIPRLARLARALEGKIARRTVVAGGKAEVAGGPPPRPAGGSGSSAAAARESRAPVDVEPPLESGAASAQPAKTPLGFKDAQAFDKFGGTLKSGLKNAGYEDATATFQGSSVTGKSFRTGEPFDVGRTSDYDVAISGKSLMDKAKELDIPLRSGGVRTGPLTDAQLKKMGLDTMRNELSQQAGRPVNFMIYSSPEEAAARAPGIQVQ